ncbi:hypothetical protein C5167_021984 [Papaver somniferum]|uniref:Uncharacterized protein n=1 Tax=Papaver somniferum TaxID=3469 RepID=A0A4Y7JHJ3_PAPSO|nr:hypothetical protein C5167_021984 [Papaver somniferum]
MLKVLFVGDHISKAESELSMGEQYNQQSAHSGTDLHANWILVPLNTWSLSKISMVKEIAHDVRIKADSPIDFEV